MQSSTDSEPTRAEILAAEPEQLRLWVAEYIDGWSWGDWSVSEKLSFPEVLTKTSDAKIVALGAAKIDGVLTFYELPSYPADISAAWLAALSFSDKYKCNVSVAVQYGDFGQTNYRAVIEGGTLCYNSPYLVCELFSDVSAADALCRALLLAQKEQ